MAEVRIILPAVSINNTKLTIEYYLALKGDERPDPTEMEVSGT